MRANEFVLGAFADLYVRTEDGEYYVCEDTNEARCWVSAGHRRPLIADPRYKEICPADSFNVPQLDARVVQRLVWTACGEAVRVVVYAFTDAGEIWRWSHGASGMETVFLFGIGSIASAMAGLVSAFASQLYQSRLKTPHPADPPSQIPAG